MVHQELDLPVITVKTIHYAVVAGHCLVLLPSTAAKVERRNELDKDLEDLNVSWADVPWLMLLKNDK